MKIKKEYHIESEGTLGCEKLKTDKHSSGKVIYIPIVTFSDNVKLFDKFGEQLYFSISFIADDYSKYDNLGSIEVRKEIFESVQKELRDEINIAIEDQVIILLTESIRLRS